MFSLISLVTLQVMSTPQGTPLPRIVVRGGHFVEKGSGKRFTPRGFNYIRLRMVGQGAGRYLWHDTLNPATYSAEKTEAMFADLERRGFNVVRLFLDHSSGQGFVERGGADELSPAYLKNLMDFLARARRHRVYVILCFCYLPGRASYHPGPPPENVAGGNQQYLHPGYVAAKARWIADVCAAIRSHDPGLLSTVLAYELENESHFIATAPPFSLTSGKIRWGDRVYDAEKPEELQRLADDAIIAAIDRTVVELHRVDPEALLGASVFTFNAVGRSGPAKLRTDRTADPRFPARPLAIARSRSAYVDVHFYPMNENTIDADYASIEWPQLREECRRRGKPMIVGEIGAFKHAYRDLPAATSAMKRALDRLQTDGWSGFLYWTYDNREQSDHLWEATAGDGAMLSVLEKAFISQSERRGGSAKS